MKKSQGFVGSRERRQWEKDTKEKLVKAGLEIYPDFSWRRHFDNNTAFESLLKYYRRWVAFNKTGSGN